MRIKSICGAVTRTFTMVALCSFFVSVDMALALSVQEQLDSRKCEIYVAGNGHVSSYKDSVDFHTRAYASNRYGFRKGQWTMIVKIQQDLIAKNCPPDIQTYVDKFFHTALKANELSCSNKDSRCAEYNNWAQNLYEAAVKNGNKSFASTIKKYSSYVRNDTKVKEATAALAKEKARKAAEKEKARKAAEKEKARKAAIEKQKADEAFRLAMAAAADAAYEAAKKKAAQEEAAKKKAAEEKAAAKQAAIDDAFSVFDITAKEAAAKIKAAKIKAAEEEAAKNKAAEEMIRFDWEWYIQEYLDLPPMTKEEAEAHFLNNGWKEGRLSSPQAALTVFDYNTAQHAEETSNSFDADWYIQEYPDLPPMTKEEAEAHFLNNGWKEGRASHAQDNQYEQFFAKIDAQLVLHMSSFDADWYRSKYPDLAHMTKEEAEAHFLNIGYWEGRSMYEGHNPDEDVLPEALYIETHDLFKYMQGFSKNSLSVLVKFHKGLQNGLSKQGKTLTDIVQKVEEEAKIATGAAAKENADKKVASNMKSEEEAPEEEAAAKQAAIDDAFSMTAEEVLAALKKVAKKETVKPIIVLNHELQNNNNILNKRKDPTILGTINYTFVPPDNKKIISNLVANSNNINLSKSINNKNGLISLELVNLSKVNLQLNDINQEVKLSTFKLQLNDINQKTNEYNDILECVNIILKYKILINPKMMKTINSQGITRTIYSSKQGLTIGSAKYNKLLTGEVGDVIPLVIYDLVNEVTNYAYGGESTFNRRDILNLASKSYEDLVKIIDDPNINKAKTISADQIEQIQRLQKEIQVSRQKNNKRNSQESSGGLAEETSVNTVEDHHHEEEEPGPAPAMSSGSMAYP